MYSEARYLSFFHTDDFRNSRKNLEQKFDSPFAWAARRSLNCCWPVVSSTQLTLTLNLAPVRCLCSEIPRNSHAIAQGIAPRVWPASGVPSIVCDFPGTLQSSLFNSYDVSPTFWHDYLSKITVWQQSQKKKPYRKVIFIINVVLKFNKRYKFFEILTVWIINNKLSAKIYDEQNFFIFRLTEI